MEQLEAGTMKAAKVVKRIRNAPLDREVLRMAAVDLGDELTRRRADVLQEFRAGLAGVQVPRDTFEDGYLAALAEIVCAAEAKILEDEKTEQLRTLLKGPHWADLVVLLEQKPLLVGEVAEALRMDRGEASRLLDDARRFGLAEIFRLEGEDGRTKRHHLTLKGRELAAEAMKASTRRA